MAMHLASMMHGSVRDREAFQHPQQAAHYFQHSQPQSQSQSQSQPHQHFQPPPQRHLNQQQQQQPAYQVHQHRPQSPPSPPAEEQKPSLPSISSLLEFAGGDKAASEPASQSPQSQHRQSSTSPQPRQAPHRQPGAMQQPPHPQMSRSEQQPSHMSANPRMTLPPTPPMHADVAHDGNTSPSAASTHSAASAAYFGASLNNMEPHRQRQSASSMPSVKRDPLPPHAMSPFSASGYGQPPYTSSPGGASSSSFYSPEQHSYNRVGMYGQQPLPSNFQPQTMPLPVPVPNSAANSSNPWQHHHYISTSSQSQFPQSQDRYICSTCNKAFSRPSSLRIHSHSHTGEKPYKCPQPNCGKAFSVRSNMKRHERGCHAATSTTLTT
ncbi:hypothetical protein J1614_004670 [Plenodomus biglobosus]|nr:hypothetical protein J1614_004670 [Plenodomus biglobosus]